MGREVKRVPLDFSWPIGVIWPGYIGRIYCACEYATKGTNNETYDIFEKYCELIKMEPNEHGDYVEKDIEPPKGHGWQMWETTTEGSPISPVFSTPEELAKWLAENNASSFGGQTATYEQWMKMIVVGWAPSAASQDGKIISGVQAIAEGEKR